MYNLFYLHVIKDFYNLFTALFLRTQSVYPHALNILGALFGAIELFSVHIHIDSYNNKYNIHIDSHNE